MNNHSDFEVSDVFANETEYVPPKAVIDRLYMPGEAHFGIEAVPMRELG